MNPEHHHHHHHHHAPYPLTFLLSNYHFHSVYQLSAPPFKRLFPLILVFPCTKKSFFCFFFFFSSGKTNIGTTEASVRQDVLITGRDVLPQHCCVENLNDTVVLYPIGACSVDGDRITSPTKLTQGKRHC